jgi:hypothetical protein
MTLVIGLVTPPVLVSHLAALALDFAQQTGLIQQVEGTVDGRNPEIVPGRLEQNVDLLRTEMLSASLHEEFKNLLTRRGPTPAKHSDLLLMVRWLLAYHWSSILVIMIINTRPT